MKLTFTEGVATFVFFCLLGSVLYITVERSQHRKSVALLEQQLASKDRTIEIGKDVYTKLTSKSDDLQNALDDKTKQNETLLKQLKATNEKLAALTSISLTFKGSPKQSSDGKLIGQFPNSPPNSDLPAPSGSTVVPDSRWKSDLYASDQLDFGFVSARCFAWNFPFTDLHPEFQLQLFPGSRPLKLNIALSQDQHRQWHSYVTTNEDDIGVNIDASSIDVSVFEPRWYERIQGRLDVGAGAGLLLGAGLQYRIDSFDVGPSFWITATDRVEKYYGLTLNWRPFERN